MGLKEAISHAIAQKLRGKPVSWVELGKQTGVHPERIRGKTRRELKKIRKPKAKVLVFDIETSPLVSYIWNRWQKFIPDNQIIEDWYVISWAGKWLFEDEVFSDIVTPEESINKDDSRVIRSLWELMNEADILIAHNGLKFDVKVMNGRFFKHGLDLPAPFQVIDTYKSALKQFKLPSFGLNYIAKYLNLPQKKPTDFELWINCMKGDKQSLDRMDAYCRNDVRVLEDVYLHMRKYIQPHPNLGLYIESDTHTCPSCSSDNLELTGTYATTVNLYDAYRCKDCGSLTRSRRAHPRKNNVTSSIPR